MNTFILRDEIIPPHDFAYQLENYVIPPESRDGLILVNVVRSKQQVVQVRISSLGTVEKPVLKVELLSQDSLSETEIRELRQGVDRWLGLSEDLKPFYSLVKDDPVMCAAIEMRYAAKDKANFTPFEAVISTICAQNVKFKRLYGMMSNICEHLGDKVSIHGVIYSAFPTPQTLASCSLDELRACKVGYRAEYIKVIAQAVETGLIDFAELEKLTYDEARQHLLRLRGIGPYTADLCLILAFRRREILHLDMYVREALWQFYFKGQEVSDDVLRQFAAKHWPGYQAWAIGMLTTNTEELAARVGITFRLKSGSRG